MKEGFYLLALQRIEGVGDIMAKNCSRIVVQLKRFYYKGFSASGYDGIGSVLLKNLRDKSVFEKTTQELEFIKSKKSVYFQDEDYRNG
jgi:DNA processing protein